MQNNNKVFGTPYFTSQDDIIHKYPYLDQNLETEVLIIGGGVTGALAAYEFSKANIKTVLIEKNVIGYGSTSITTALLQYELDDPLSVLEKKIGVDQAIEAYRMGIDALDMLEELVNEVGNTFDYQRRDCLLFSDKKKVKERQAVQYEFGIRESYGFDVEYVDEKNTPFDFKMYCGVVGKKGGAELDPYMFTQVLIEKAIENGLIVHEKTEALNYEEHDNSVVVTVSNNKKISAKKVIVATGYGLEPFKKEDFATLYTTYNVVTEPLPFDPWFKNMLLKSMDEPYYYYRTTSDNRVIIGGEDSHLIPNNLEEFVASMKYQKLEKKLREFLGDKSISFDYKYSGTFAVTDDNLGYFGPYTADENIYLALGYGANGILFAVVGAKILVDLYLNNDNKYYSLMRANRK